MAPALSWLFCHVPHTGTISNKYLLLVTCYLLLLLSSLFLFPRLLPSSLSSTFPVPFSSFFSSFSSFFLPFIHFFHIFFLFFLLSLSLIPSPSSLRPYFILLHLSSPFSNHSLSHIYSIFFISLYPPLIRYLLVFLFFHFFYILFFISFLFSLCLCFLVLHLSLDFLCLLN